MSNEFMPVVLTGKYGSQIPLVSWYQLWGALQGSLVPIKVPMAIGIDSLLIRMTDDQLKLLSTMDPLLFPFLSILVNLPTNHRKSESDKKHILYATKVLATTYKLSHPVLKFT